MALCRDSFIQYLHLEDFRNTVNTGRSPSIRDARGSSQSPAQYSFPGLGSSTQLNLRTRQKKTSPKVYGKCFPDRTTNSISQNNPKTNLSVCCKCYPEMEGKNVRLLYYINFDRLITKIQVNQDQRHITSFIQHLDYLICSLSSPSEAGSYDRVDVMKQIYHVGIWANHYKEKLEHQLLKNMTAHTIAPWSAFTAIWDTSLFWIWSKCFISSFFLRDRLCHI